MKKLLGVGLACVLMLQILALPVFVWADETIEESETETALILDIPVSADTMVQKNAENNNFGARDQIYSVARQGVLSREIFLKFDLSDICDMGFQVTKAELSITAIEANNDNNAREFSIYRVLNSGGDTWTEGTGAANPSSDEYKNGTSTGVDTDLTWNNSRTMSGGDSGTDMDNVSLLHNSVDGAGKTNNLNANGRAHRDGTSTVCDITMGVQDELKAEGNSKFLTLNIVTDFHSDKPNQTWGLTIYSKEAKVADELKPRLILTLDAGDADKLAVYRDAAALDLSDYERVNRDFTLPTEGNNGATISWTSSNVNVLSIQSGQVTYTDPGTATEVTLTAVISKNGVSKQQEYKINVLPAGLQDTDLDLQGISVSYAHPSLTMELPISGTNGSTISWTSSNTSIIDPTGITTDPNDSSKGIVQVNRLAMEAATVTLTAMAAKTGCASAEETYTVEIPALDRLIADRDTYVAINNSAQTSTTVFGDSDIMKTEGVKQKIFLGFDLSRLPAGKTIKSAKLYLTKHEANSNWLNLYYMQNNNWDEKTLTGKNCDETFSAGVGEKVAEMRLGGGAKDQYTSFSADITAAVWKALGNNDKYLTLEGYKFSGCIAGENSAKSNYNSTLCTKEHAIADYSPTGDYRPYLTFEYANNETEIALIEQLKEVNLPSVITNSLTLPQTTTDKKSITWSDPTDSNYPQDCIGIEQNAAVVVPQNVETTVRLRATVTEGETSVSKDCFVTMRSPNCKYVILDPYFQSGSNLVISPLASTSLYGIRVQKIDEDVTESNLIFAVYDANNALVDIKIKNFTSENMELGEQTMIKFDSTDTISFSNKATKYKVMIWNNTNQLIPLAEQYLWSAS